VDDVFPKRGKDADNDNIDNRESEKRNKKETLRVICCCYFDCDLFE